MSRYHYYYGYQKNRHIIFDIISAVFFGFFLYFATLVGNVASFYISRAVG
jgi:hypothetical protein